MLRLRSPSHGLRFEVVGPPRLAQARSVEATGVLAAPDDRAAALGESEDRGVGNRRPRPQHQHRQGGRRHLNATSLVAQLDRVVGTFDADLLGVKERPAVRHPRELREIGDDALVHRLSPRTLDGEKAEAEGLGRADAGCESFAEEVSVAHDEDSLEKGTANGHRLASPAAARGDLGDPDLAPVDREASRRRVACEPAQSLFVAANGHASTVASDAIRSGLGVDLPRRVRAQTERKPAARAERGSLRLDVPNCGVLANA